MESVVREARSIVEFALLDNHCPDCSHEMQLSIGVMIDTDQPAQLSWVCNNHTIHGKPQYKLQRVLYVPLEGKSHSEKIAYVNAILEQKEFSWWGEILSKKSTKGLKRFVEAMASLELTQEQQIIYQSALDELESRKQPASAREEDCNAAGSRPFN